MKVGFYLFDIHNVLASTLPAKRLRVRIRCSHLERQQGIYFLEDRLEHSTFSRRAERNV